MASVTNSQLKAWVEQYKNRVAHMLGIPTSAVPDINISLDKVEPDPEGNVPAATTDATGTIVVNKDWAKNAVLDDIEGAVIHEIAHAVYSVDKGQYTDPKARKHIDQVVERMADAVRYRLLGEVGGWEASDEAIQLANLKPWQLKTVEGQMIAGNYSPRLVTQLQNGTIKKEDVVDPNALTDENGTPYSGTNFYPGYGEGTAGIDTGGAPPPGSTEDDAKKAAAARRKLKSSYELYVQGLGIPISDDVMALIREGAGRGWSLAQFQLKLQDDPAFKQRFPGIFNNDGTLKMTTAEYMQSEKLFQSYASQAGLNMNGKRMAYLFRNDVTPDEFSDRAVAVSRLNKNKDLYASFKRELVQAGVAKPSEVNTNREMFKFVMGEGNKKWADVWQDSLTRYQANQAGITIARNKDRYTAIGQKALEKISSMDLSEEEMASKFLQLSEVLGEALPLQEAQLYGLKKRTAIQAVFGGKGSERARQKIERVVKTDEAFYQDRASNPMYSDERGGVVTQGVTDRSKQQTSEY